MSNTWQEVMEYFLGKTIGDIWPSDRRLITVRTTQTVAECLKVLEDNMILSVPVVGPPPSSSKSKEQEDYFLGMIDTTDILMFILATHNPDCVLGGSSNPALLQDFQKGVSSIQAEFERTSVGQLLEKSKQWTKTRQEDVFPEYYRKSDSLFEMIGMFSIGLHRVAVLSEDSELSPTAAEAEAQDDNNVHAAEEGTTQQKPKKKAGIPGKRQLVNVVTQSDLLAVLGQCLPLFGSSLQTKTMKDMHLFDKPLITASANQPVIEVLAQMRSDSPIIAALPIVEDGDKSKLMATFSSSNLKGLHQSDWKDLTLGCLDFLQRQFERDKDKPFPVSIQSRKSLSPITCTQSDSLETVIMRMISSRVHRLWCVESPETNKLIGVVSMSDIFQILMPAELFQSCFII